MIRENDEALRVKVDAYMVARTFVLLEAAGLQSAEGTTELDVQARAMELRDFWKPGTEFYDCEAREDGQTWWDCEALLLELDRRAAEAIEWMSDRGGN